MKNLFKLIIVTYLCLILTSCTAPASEAQEAKLDNPYMVLVNKTNKLPDNWTDLVNFEVGKNSLGEIYIVEEATLRAFEELRADLLENEGIKIELDSTYRSLGEQQDIWDIWSADPEKGPEYCEQYLAPVGCSEHHTGLAIDVFLIRNGEIIRDNDDMINDVRSFASVHKRLASHGFILRYIEGKEDITGYEYEPWHFRFINDKEVAQEIMDKNLTLEEYLEQ